jgi:hypothetical protein
MPNVKSVISRHNNHSLSKSTTNYTPLKSDNCNCNDPSECPIKKNCKSKNIIYKAQVISPDDGVIKEYIGMTANTFKERYGSHKKSYDLQRNKNDTELSKYIWELKSSDRDYILKWSILKRAGAYSSGAKRCNLCIEEKLCIMDANKHVTLNKRPEIFAKCRHREKFWAGNIKLYTGCLKKNAMEIQQAVVHNKLR